MADSAERAYSSQDEEQDTYSFHGIQTTGGDGRYGFTTVKPVSYTVPTDGPVGDILRATGGIRGAPRTCTTSSRPTVSGRLLPRFSRTTTPISMKTRCSAFGAIL